MTDIWHEEASLLFHMARHEAESGRGIDRIKEALVKAYRDGAIDHQLLNEASTVAMAAVIRKQVALKAGESMEFDVEKIKESLREEGRNQVRNGMI